MADLEDFVFQSMLEGCKLDACLDPFLDCINKLRSKIESNLPDSRTDFSCFQGEDLRKAQSAAAELLTNINRLLPGFLDNPNDVLSNETLRKRLEDGRQSFARAGYLEGTYPWFREEQQKPAPLSPFHKSLFAALEAQCHRPKEQGQQASKTTTPTLTQLAFDQACRQIEQSIVGERASATFVCGGTIPIDSAPPADSVGPKKSPPVHLFWLTGGANQALRLELPLSHDNNPDSSIGRLRQLVDDCQPASFGRGQQDVIDPSYRKAGKLDPGHFASTFHPADFDIVANVAQILLPPFRTEAEGCVPFQKLRAELYKLNGQIGSLVVCLPSGFEGGSLIVQHDGQQVEFDWASQSGTAIQWAAFYSDCEHEIKTVSAGERITLTYNLYLTESAHQDSPQNSIVDPRSLPLYGLLKDTLAQPGFMKDGISPLSRVVCDNRFSPHMQRPRLTIIGGVLGIYCSHAYPHSSSQASALLPRGLKGADLALYSTLKSLGIELDVLPILCAEDELRFYESGQLEDFLREGKPFEPEYAQLPYKIPLDVGVDRYWKILFLSRYVQVGEDFMYFVKSERLPITATSFMRRPDIIGAQLNPYRTTDRGEEEQLIEVIHDTWPSTTMRGITWIVKPQHHQMAFSYLAYGNQCAIGTVYSYAAILAVIPPYHMRQAVMNQRG
ncbi:uncharacterized protein N7459_001360 [Penicillium hispanicum]|uniref:uncharacterized protein n=1 Tax=Penicillium hispanicum TaxID=1080232 RepID=UPI0025403D00|nr:uncharacterized protein N7459_001360 [Penicillium hispanicum]KAJ5595152.1 hypothetical protein N7459_001360 [Penicillium hispanicum]